MLDHAIMQSRIGFDLFRASARCERGQDGKPMARICLLGGLTIYAGDRELVLPNRKAMAMIAYLVLAPGSRETRDRLAGLLWSETENTSARASLRQLLYLLRMSFEAVGLTVLSADKTNVSLNRSAFRTDLDDFLESVDRGDPTDIPLHLEDINSSFLRGYDDIDPSFGSWMSLKRENVRRTLIQRLEAQLAEGSHRPDVTKRLARALFQIDPTHEIACQKLMKAYIDLGSSGSALGVYKQLWEHLEEEYDIEPSAATQELAVAIKSGEHVPRFADIDPLSAQADLIGDSEADKIASIAIKLALAWIEAKEAGRITPASARSLLVVEELNKAKLVRSVGTDRRGSRPAVGPSGRMKTSIAC